MEPPSIRLAGRPPFVDAGGLPLTGGPAGPFRPPTGEGEFGGIGVEGLDPAIGGATSQGEGTRQFDPGGGGGGTAAFCFEWFGLKWGKAYASVYDWNLFQEHLASHGQGWEAWACNHPVWWECLINSPGPNGAGPPGGPCGNPTPLPKLLYVVISGAGPGTKQVAGKLTVAGGRADISLSTEADEVTVIESITHGYIEVDRRTTYHENVTDISTVPWEVDAAMDWAADEAIRFGHTIKVRARAGSQSKGKTYTVARDLPAHREVIRQACGSFFSIGPKAGVPWEDGSPLNHVTAAAYYIMAPDRTGRLTRAQMTLSLSDPTGAVVARKRFEWPVIEGRHLYACLGKRFMALQGDAVSHEALLNSALGAERLDYWELRVTGAVVWINDVRCDLLPINSHNVAVPGFKGDTSRLVPDGGLGSNEWATGYPFEIAIT